MLEVSGNFAAGLVDAVQQINGHRQTLLGLGLSDELTNQFTTLKDDPLTGAGDMGEETMFNRIVLGTIGGIMGDTDFNADLINERL